MKYDAFIDKLNNIYWPKFGYELRELSRLDLLVLYGISMTQKEYGLMQSILKKGQRAAGKPAKG